MCSLLLSLSPILEFENYSKRMQLSKTSDNMDPLYFLAHPQFSYYSYDELVYLLGILARGMSVGGERVEECYRRYW